MFRKITAPNSIQSNLKSYCESDIEYAVRLLSVSVNSLTYIGGNSFLITQVLREILLESIEAIIIIKY